MNISQYVKQGSHHALVLAATALFSRGLLFFFLPYILSKFTIAEFGVWDFYQHFLSFGTMVISSGATMALTRFYIVHKDNPDMQRAAVGNACLAVVCAALMLSYGSACAMYFLTGYGATHTLAVAVTVLFALFFVVLAYLRVVEQLALYAFVFCAQSATALILSVVGVHYNLGIQALFYAYGISLVIFVPLFVRIAYAHRSYSWPLFKEQVRYSMPLLAYNSVALGFFTLDRLWLARISDELLGVYGLLWKFGAVYQCCALTITNAAPLVIFQAHQDKKDNQVIPTLVTYVSILLLLGALVSVYVTQYVLMQWFPACGGAWRYAPLFFAFIGLLEVAKLMQTGFHLAVKTVYIPVLALVMLGVQALLCVALQPCGLWGVCSANICTFMLYALVSYRIGWWVYPQQIVDARRLSAAVALYLGTLALVMVSVHPALVSLCWALFLWWCGVPHAEGQEPESVTVHDHAYSTGVTDKRIALFGPYPPPLGGIAVHVQRVGAKLQQQGNTVFFFDTEQHCFIARYGAKLVHFLRAVRADIVYYHTPYVRRGLVTFFLLVLLQKIMRFHLVFVEHDAQEFKKHAALRNKIFAWSVMRAHHVVFIGNTPYMSYRERAVIPSSFSVESAFLPPDLTQEGRILATYPQELFTFLARSSPVILMNAFQVRLVDDIDLYGYDMCLDLLRRVRQVHPQAGLVFALASIGNHDHYERMCARAQDFGLSDSIYILHGQKELWPLYKLVDIFVRPTLFDNYGISVAEARYFNVPAVASDVCVRPAGTVLFAKRDGDAFYANVMAALPARFTQTKSVYSCPRELGQQGL